MSLEITQEERTEQAYIAGKITIISPNEHINATCYKVISSDKFKGGKNVPHYALFSVSEGSSFFGQPTTFLAWYADEEQISKEISDVQSAIRCGISSYELKYSVKVAKHWLKRNIVSKDDSK